MRDLVKHRGSKHVTTRERKISKGQSRELSTLRNPEPGKWLSPGGMSHLSSAVHMASSWYRTAVTVACLEVEDRLAVVHCDATRVGPGNFLQYGA